MDALQLLIADHNRVKGLFKRFEEAEGENDAQAAKLAGMIFEELEVHTKIEEEVFYPTITKINDEIHELVTEGIEEHHVVDRLMEEINSLGVSDEQWAAKMKVLMENVEHHAGEEEEELFKKVRQAMNSEALKELGQRLEAKKKELGAPISADKENLTTEELQKLAREQEIPGRSSMNREELLATVAPKS